jgi:hypothetical protein|tara:strand:+ start:263 stop:679 length:417 start_codon:yes stop_codon:yes gene_type:complete
MKKQNEIIIFEEFRIKPSEEEKEEIEALKKEFKETPIKATGALLFLAALTPFTGEGTKFYKKTVPQLITVFKSSIRDAAINDVSQSIRKKNKKVYQYKKKELKKLITRQENRIRKKGRLGLVKKLIYLYLGVGFLPFA